MWLTFLLFPNCASEDRNGDFHYDLISALHKSLRGGALQQAVACDQAVHAIGMPEAAVVIAQCDAWPHK